MTTIIDVHSHFYPRWYIDLLKARTEIPRVVDDAGAERFVIFPGEHGRPIDQEYWDLDAKLEFMDRVGISQTVLSLGNPWLDLFSQDDEIGIARRTNSFFASLEQETGGRLIGMGALPAGRVEGAVEIASEIAEAEGLYGVIVGTRICGKPMDDEALEPLWQVLDATGLPMFVHPRHTASGEELKGFGHAFPVAMGFPFETTIALARLVFAGVLGRFPRLRIVASHGGGTIPFLLGRLDSAWRSDPSVHGRLPELPSQGFARLNYDAVLYDAAAMRATADLVGTRRMPWGTDHPFSGADPSVSLNAVTDAFDETGRREVLSESAQGIFGIPSWDG